MVSSKKLLHQPTSLLPLNDISGVVLRATNIAKTYVLGERRVETIRSLSFTLSKGEVVCIVGPSGCGKTTMLKILTGLTQADAGDVRLADVNRPPMLLFQDYNACLLPYYSVRRNISIALRASHVSCDEANKHVERALDLVGLRDFGEAYPWQLSGGMKQRILLARAIAAKPSVICLDEPFASVDALTRYGLEDELRRLAKVEQTAVLYITHDVDSAVYLADRVLVMSARPAVLKAEIVTPLGVDRKQATTRASSLFAQIRGKVFEQL